MKTKDTKIEGGPFTQLVQNLPLFVMIIGFSVTTVLAYWDYQTQISVSDQIFTRLCDRQITEIHRRLGTFIDGLEGVRGVYAASDYVTSEDFRNYVISRDLPAEFPGSLGFGFVERVERNSIEEFISKRKAEGSPMFSVQTSGDADNLYIIKYIEPLDRLGSAIGLDLGSDKNRREAADRAMTSGSATLTSLITLGHVAGSPPGFLFLLPIYRNGAILNSEQSRIQNLKGWALAPISVESIFSGLTDYTNQEIDFEVFDGEALSAQNQIYDYDGHLKKINGEDTEDAYGDRTFSRLERIHIGGRLWSVKLSTTPRFDQSTESKIPWAILFSSGTITVLFAAVIFAMVRTRFKALELAFRMSESARESEHNALHSREKAERALADLSVYTHKLKDANRLIAEEQQRLALALAGGNLGLWDWDLASGSVVFDERWALMLGVQPADLPNKLESWFERVHPTDLAMARVALDKHFAERTTSYEITHRMRHADGRWVWILAKGRVVDRAADGSPLRMVGTNADVTALVETEDRLLKAKALMDVTSEMANVGGWEYTVETQLVAWSEQIYRIHEVPQNEMPSLDTAMNFYPPEARPILAEAMQRAVTEGTGFDLELPFVTAKGKRIWVRTVGRAVVVNGNCQKINGSFQDITDRKNAEIALQNYAAEMNAAREREASQAVDLRQAYSEVENASRAKSEFLANMSHEIRTPMNAVMGMTELVLESELNAEQRDLLTTAHFSAKTLLRIINDILDLSKIEAGKMPLSETSFDLRALFENVIDSVAVRADEKRIQLRSSLPDTLPAWAFGDDLRLRQVLTNLVGNAIKFAGEEGKILVDVTSQTVAREAIILSVTVSDTGQGIPEHMLESIFEPFTQGDNSTTRKFGGTGLGLAICRQLVELMKGEIKVRSVIGHGAAFSFSIPLTVVSAAEAFNSTESISETYTNFKKLTQQFPLRVLLVEDNVINQKLAQKLLEKLGCSVSTAVNGREAVTHVAQNSANFDVVMMDCQMPELGGLDATRIIRESERGTQRHIPIVAMTANAMAGDRDACLDAGMDEYLSKPIDRRQLAKILTQLFDDPSKQTAESRRPTIQ